MSTEPEIAAWLETIEDADIREAVAAAFEVTTAEVEDDADDVFTPFVYPH